MIFTLLYIIHNSVLCWDRCILLFWIGNLRPQIQKTAYLE